ARLRRGLVRDFVQALPRQNPARRSCARAHGQDEEDEVSPAMGAQVPTFPTTIEEIMGTPEFVLGVIDGRAGRAHRSAYATWETNKQWNYERGRAWAALPPRSVVLKRNGEITVEAKRWFTADIL